MAPITEQLETKKKSKKGTKPLFFHGREHERGAFFKLLTTLLLDTRTRRGGERERESSEERKRATDGGATTSMIDDRLLSVTTLASQKHIKREGGQVREKALGSRSDGWQ